MSDQRPGQASSHYVDTVRDGAVAANIFRGQSGRGRTYLYFELSRAWKSADGQREGYSHKFFRQHAESLSNVIALAAQWIDQHQEEGVAATADPEADDAASAVSTRTA